MSDSEYATRSANQPAAKKKTAGATMKGKKDQPTDQHDQGERGVQPEDDHFPEVAENTSELRTRMINITGAKGVTAGETWDVTVTVGGSRGVKPWSKAVLDTNGALGDAQRQLTVVSITEGSSVWRIGAQREYVERFADRVLIQPRAAKPKPKPKR